jgi:hypothetical protein
MTKYILNSGGVKKNPEVAKKFFAEMVRGFGEHPKVLICCFAQPRQYWEAKFADDKARTHLFPEHVQPEFELAFPDTFAEQIAGCDALYIHGGDDHLLLYWLRKFDIPTIWEGKVVATSSASSQALSKHFWTCDWRQTRDGLGVLPIKFIAHFDSDYGADDPRGPIDWDAAYQVLKNYGDTTLPIHALKEAEYVVFEQ